MGIDKTKRQKRQALRAMLVRLATSAALGTLIVGCFYGYEYLTTSERLAIEHVEYHGLSRMDTERIDRMLADLTGQNILLAPLDSYVARFTDHARIRTARFKRVLPNRVICSFTEREPVALVYAGKFLEVDRDGMIMNSDALTNVLDLPVITGLETESIREGQLCEAEGLRRALATLAICKTHGGAFADDISELRIAADGISIVSLKEGVVLLLGNSEFDGRLRKYFLLKNSIAENNDAARLIDLRFDDQIVLRNRI